MQNRPYIIYLSLDEFLRGAHKHYANLIHVQPMQTQEHSRSLPLAGVTSAIMLTAETGSNGPILGTRIVLERGQIMGSDPRSHQLTNAMHARAEEITTRLTNEIEEHGLLYDAGMIAVPGLLDDLQTKEADPGRRWQIEQPDRNDTLSRRLVWLDEPPID